MGRIPASRRQARSTRITAAVVLLGVASLCVAAAIAARQQFLVGIAGVFALAVGWTALRLAWSGIVESRYEHAVDRTELAQAYRELFATRAVEHAEFVGSMAGRLAHRDRTIDELEGAMSGVEMRAVEAEASALTYRRRLGEAVEQIGAMEALITRQLHEHQEQQAARRASEQSEEDDLRRSVVPEWADLEADPVTALLAWEEHAADVSRSIGRHAAGNE